MEDGEYPIELGALVVETEVDGGGGWRGGERVFAAAAR